jgi:hypothetical protein
MSSSWDNIVNSASNTTKEELGNRISSLTRLNNKEIEDCIFETGISHKDLSSVLKEVSDATKSNEDKANAIKSINKGLEALICLSKSIL